MRTKWHYFCRLFPMLLLIFIDSFSFFVLIPVLLKIFYHAHYGLLTADVSTSTRNILTGATISLSMLAALIFAPIVGRASDKYGRKKTLLWCIVFVFLGFLFPMIGILKKNIALILLGRFVSGIGSGGSQPVAQATVADLCKGEDKAIYLSFIALMMTLALIVGPVAGGVLSDPQVEPFFNVATPFAFSICLSVINFLLILFFFKETIHTTVKESAISFWQTITQFPALIKRYHIAALVVLFFSLELGWSQYYQAINLFLHLKFHLHTEMVSLFSSSMGIVMAIGLMIVYPVLLRFCSVKTIMGYSMGILLFGLLMCSVLPSLLSQWIFSSLVAISTGCAYVSLVALISNAVSDDKQGLVMGYLSTILYFAWMATAFDSGFLISLHLTMPLYLATLFLIIGTSSRLFFYYNQHVIK